MRAPSFWWRDAGIAASLLAPISRVYGGIAERRLTRAGETIGIPVLCIGNPTLGGAGKTPTAIAAAKGLIAAGERPVFLTRGYGGRLKGPIAVDPIRHHADAVGDEARLLARTAPTIVARDRVAGARQAQSAGATIVVMDDGFQNPSLTKTFCVLVVDARRSIGNGRVFPAGPLRAPPGAQFDRANAVIVVGETQDGRRAADQLNVMVRSRGLPILLGRLEPDRRAVEALSHDKLLAFAGIGNPEKFFATLERDGLKVAVRRSFPDHHRYTTADIRALLQMADHRGLTPVTTEKDFSRLEGDRAAALLVQRTKALPVKLVLEQQDLFDRLLLAAAKPSR